MYFNNQSRNQVVAVLEEVNVEHKIGKGRRNFGTDLSCSEFHVFNGAKLDFYLKTDIFRKFKTGKIGKPQIVPLLAKNMDRF